MSDLQYKRNAELRGEIAYTVGGDPSRYFGNRNTGLRKAEVARVVEALRQPSDDSPLHEMTLAELYRAACALAGGEYQGTAGNQWSINRPNLKRIHRALEARDPREVTA